MAKHHYQPAALIGGFSADSSRSLRERVVWVRRRGMSRAFYNSAENLGYVRDLYTLIEDHGQPPDMIDRAWRVYEPGLPDGIAALIDSHARPLRADVWTRVLVPFVVGLFVRGPEFNRRFETRLVPIIGTTSTFFTPTRITDNTNQARLFEMQRLMFPIATAEWTVVHCTGSGIAITSDVGYCLMRHLQGGGVGYAIPLRPDAVLVLRKGPHHLIAHSAGGSWVMGGIQHAAGAPETISGLNTAIATTAMAEVYGPTERVVDTSAQAWQHGNSALSHAPGPYWLADNPKLMRDQEMSWVRMLLAFSVPPSSGSPTIVRMR